MLNITSYQKQYKTRNHGLNQVLWNPGSMLGPSPEGSNFWPVYGIVINQYYKESEQVLMCNVNSGQDSQQRMGDPSLRPHLSLYWMDDFSPDYTKPKKFAVAKSACCRPHSSFCYHFQDSKNIAGTSTIPHNFKLGFCANRKRSFSKVLENLVCR